MLSHLRAGILPSGMKFRRKWSMKQQLSALTLRTEVGNAGVGSVTLNELSLFLSVTLFRRKGFENNGLGRNTLSRQVLQFRAETRVLTSVP